MRRALLILAVSLALVARAQTANCQGVAADSILVGVSSAFKGHAASLGTELYRGYMAYFAAVNEKGGVNGRQIKVVAYDDGYDPAEAVKNTNELIVKDRVFILFGNVGTPTTVKVLPLLLKFKDIPIYMFSPFTGAQAQREDPYVPFCINVRSSYRQETAALVDYFFAGGKKRIGVFYQNDAYGVSGQDGVKRALAAKGLSIVVESNFMRGATFDQKMTAQVSGIMSAGADAIVAVGTYQACAAFVRDARKAGFKGPIANISFVGSEALLSLLEAQGRSDGRSYTEELYNSQVVPSYEDASLPLVKQYREDMASHAVVLPPDLKDPSYVPSPLSFGSLEGYLNAVIFVRALQQAGDALTADSFMKKIEAMSGLDVGIGSPISFGPGDHQGLDTVYITKASGGKWVSIR